MRLYPRFMGTSEPRSVNMAARVAYAEDMARHRPSPPPQAAQSGWTDEETAPLHLWLWAMAQPFLGLPRAEAAAFAERFSLSIDERPIGPSGAMYGELYSQPRTINLAYDDDGFVAQVAVEGIWPN